MPPGVYTRTETCYLVVLNLFRVYVFGLDYMSAEHRRYHSCNLLGITVMNGTAHNYFTHFTPRVKIMSPCLENIKIRLNLPQQGLMLQAKQYRKSTASPSGLRQQSRERLIYSLCFKRLNTITFLIPSFSY